MLETLWTAFRILCVRFYRWGKRFVKNVLLFLVLVWFAIVYGIDSRFDETCIEGRLSAEQAEAINSLEWDKCPSYRNGECRAEWNDRVFVGQCSEASKFLWRPHKWIQVLDGATPPWEYGEAPWPFGDRSSDG